MTDYENRQAWDLPSWPEMYSNLQTLQFLDGKYVLRPDEEKKALAFMKSSELQIEITEEL